MKGIIFNLVQDAITRDHGGDGWDDLVDSAGISGTYTALGNYPDADLSRIVTAGADAFDVPVPELVRAVGRDALMGLSVRYPHFFEPHDDVRSFVLTLNEVIHAEVRKLHADSDPPDFWFDDPAAQPLTVHYRSRRQLCLLAEGMLEGAGGYFGQDVTVTQTSCMADGHDHCTFLLQIEEQE